MMWVLILLGMFIFTKKKNHLLGISVTTHLYVVIHFTFVFCWDLDNAFGHIAISIKFKLKDLYWRFKS